jgi:phage gp45-like
MKMAFGEGQVDWTFLHGSTPIERVTIPELVVEMCQDVFILPLFGDVSTLPLTGVTSREVT